METQTQKDPALSAESTVPDNGPRPKLRVRRPVDLELPTFKLGDEVAWESQAGGYTKRKVGKVVEVVKAGEMPTQHESDPGVQPRSRQSYVVKTGTETYWPLASKLEERRASKAAKPQVKAKAKMKVKPVVKAKAKPKASKPKVKPKKAAKAERPWYTTGAKPSRELRMTGKLEAVLKAFGGVGKKATLKTLATKAWKFKGAKASSWTRNQLRSLRFHKLVKQVGKGEYQRLA